MTHRLCAFCVLLVLLGAVNGGAAQGVSGEPFSSLSVDAGLAMSSGLGDLDRFWESGTGASLRFSTPFHVGSLAVGIRVLPYRPIADVPKFNGALFHASWGAPVISASWFSLHLGGRLGNLRMAFDDDSQPGVRNESEFTVGGEALLRVGGSRRSGLTIGWSLERTFTKKPLDLQFLTVTYGYRFAMPEWLGGILK
ncbi:MAG: hypothetical protein ACI80V_002644 [Rhodothermales bacterium]